MDKKEGRLRTVLSYKSVCHSISFNAQVNSEKCWYGLQSKARVEIAGHKRVIFKLSYKVYIYMDELYVNYVTQPLHILVCLFRYYLFIWI